MKVGETVILSKIHHKMNSRLKNNVGKCGKIILVSNNEKVLVDFEGFENSFWIHLKYLKNTSTL